MGNLGLATRGVETPDHVQLPAAPRPLHRLALVRRLQGVSRRAMARRMSVDVTRIKLQERPTADLLLSQLYHWQRALEVPIHELLIDEDEQLSEPVRRKAQMLRMLKTALAIAESSAEEPVRRMAQTLIDQILDASPELDGVASWHSVGQRRSRDELGVAAVRRLSEDVFIDLMD